MKYRLLFTTGIILSSALLQTGCESHAKPAPNSGFLPKPELMTKNDLVPVQRIWKNPAYKTETYNKIVVLKVDLDHQLKLNSQERSNVREMMGDSDKDVQDFAVYIENAFKKAIKEDKDHRFELVEEPGPATMALKLALVKVVAGKPVKSGLKNITRLSPIGAAISPITMTKQSYTDSAKQASVAIEGCLLDSMTGSYICMFADRRKSKTAFINLNDFTAYGNLEQLMDLWAYHFVEVLKKRPLETGMKYDLDSSSVTFINY